MNWYCPRSFADCYKPYLKGEHRCVFKVLNHYRQLMEFLSLV